jgi:hypothetical protein
MAITICRISSSVNCNRKLTNRLTVTYAGGRTQQFSVRRERVAEVRG